MKKLIKCDCGCSVFVSEWLPDIDMSKITFELDKLTNVPLKEVLICKKCRKILDMFNMKNSENSQKTTITFTLYPKMKKDHNPQLYNYILMLATMPVQDFLQTVKPDMENLIEIVPPVTKTIKPAV